MPRAIRATCRFTPPRGGEPVPVEAVFAEFCDRDYEPGQRYCAAGEPVWATPHDGSAPLTNDVRGKIVLLERGAVDFITKAKHAADAGAVAVIIVNTEDALEPIPVTSSGEHVQIPVVMIKSSALSDKRLSVKGGFGGQPPPSHANPDGPSFCILLPASMGPSGSVDFRTLIDGIDGLYEDKDFPADSSSLYVDPRQPKASLAGKKIVWVRPEKLSDDPKLFMDDTTPGDILQGALGDCYFLSSAAILCSSKDSTLLTKLFVKTQYFKNGMVGVRFYKCGVWMDVAIDTLIPCTETRGGHQPVFVRMQDPNEFWMILLEKAYAKLHGCYEALDGGFMNESLQDMSGGCPGRVKITDLFSCSAKGGRVDKVAAMALLKSKSKGELLQGASSDAGGCEEALGHGLYSGHAYAILDVKQASTGELLVSLRNPWGSHEWTGAWSDNDRRWTPELKAEFGHTAGDDGTFWMSIDDFVRYFTKITYVDMVPKSFTVLRAEGMWSKETAGGCCNNNTWKDNPQILLRVKQASHISIELDQPDTRLQSKTLGKVAFDALYEGRSGYDHYIGFSFVRGSQRKRYLSEKDEVAEASYTNVRTVSATIENCPPGDYLIIPTTFDPVSGLGFTIKVFASSSVELIDTRGGKDVQIFDAGEDQIDQAAIPISLAPPSPKPEPEEEPEEDIPPPEPERVKKHEFKWADNQISGLLSNFQKQKPKATWQVGEKIPDGWARPKDFTIDANNEFQVGEICAIMRSDRTVRFGKIGRTGDGTSDVICGVSPAGPIMKANIPAQYIAKLPATEDGLPQALVDQVSVLFDTLDTDGSGALPAHWDSPELSSDLGKRLLMEMGVRADSFVEMYHALKELDANQDGLITKDEFIAWFAKKAIGN